MKNLVFLSRNTLVLTTAGMLFAGVPVSSAQEGRVLPSSADAAEASESALVADVAVPNRFYDKMQSPERTMWSCLCGTL